MSEAFENEQTPVEEQEVVSQTAEAPVKVKEPDPDLQASAKIAAGFDWLVNKAAKYCIKAFRFVKDYVCKAKKNPKMWIAPGAIAAGLVIAIVVIALLVGLSDYTKALDNYLDVNFKGKVSKIESLAPQEYWDYVEENGGETLDDLKEFFEENWDSREDSLGDMYGDNYKVTYKVKDEDKLSSRKVEKIAEALEEKYDINADSVKKAYEVDLKLKISGSEDDSENNTTMTFVQIGLKWYIIHYSESDGEYYVRFYVENLG